MSQKCVNCGQSFFEEDKIVKTLAKKLFSKLRFCSVECLNEYEANQFSYKNNNSEKEIENE